MTWRIRDRATFEALARTRRHRRGPLWVRGLRDVGGDPDRRARVAYAIPRSAGSAVARNRIRRRLREALQRAEADGRLPAGAYLVGASSEALSMSFADLERALGELIDLVGPRGGDQP